MLTLAIVAVDNLDFMESMYTARAEHPTVTWDDAARATVVHYHPLYIHLFCAQRSQDRGVSAAYALLREHHRCVILKYPGMSFNREIGLLCCCNDAPIGL